MKVLVTGGTGYIGSHTVVALLERGDEVFVVDNLGNSDAAVMDGISRITGRSAGFLAADVRDASALSRVFKEFGPDAVIHFAGLKAVAESVQHPLRYYDCNVRGTLSLLQAMQEHRVNRMVFSSSATVYGDRSPSPLSETAPIAPINPYGHSKAMVEQILVDLRASNPGWQLLSLRYFNPAGAHESGLIGEDPCGIPNNLMPYIAQVAAGQREKIQVYGNDWPTPDGTGVRDYIHVMDLAAAHLAALDALDNHLEVPAINIGTGRGHSVLEVIAAYERACGRPLAREIAPRRPGDSAQVFCDPSLAHKRLGWQSTRNLDAMCRDSWQRVQVAHTA